MIKLQPANKTFFLWGQRQTGKSTLLKSSFPNAKYINLLKSEEFLDYSTKPSLLRERLAEVSKETVIIIDEVQKIPLLLNEIHYLIEERGFIFALCGSSARKLKRGQANLLGGRARRRELLGLVSSELGEEFDLKKIVNRGYLPSHYDDEEYFQGLQSYIADYLKQEILDEGLIRSLPIFARFLEVAAIGDTETLNFSNIARECSVSSKTVHSYYDILVDTLVGDYLPAYRKKPKRRITTSPKFYFHDVGVVNYLARRRMLEPKSKEFGKAFENFIFHELSAFIKYSFSDYPLYFWQLSTGVEVDFILGDMETAIEVKSSESINSNHLKNLRELIKDQPDVGQRIIVCLEKEVRKTEDGILILPYQEFLKRLWNNSLKPDVKISFVSPP